MGKNLEGRVALVTGGSRGIGRAICVELADRGAQVIVNFRSNEAEAEETVKLCAEKGGQAFALQFDVADSAQVDQAFAALKERTGRLDILVNNAGISKDGLILRLKDEDWHSTLSTNLHGAFYTVRAAAKIMVKARCGSIVQMSSVVGEMGNAGQVPYVSSKAGMLGLTKALARELAPRGIRVNSITPGFIETDMTAELDENLKQEHFKAIPLGRYGKPEDVAHAVAFLVSDEAAYITGQTIGVNGGMLMR
ncbi:MAG: 3-oxoacyl-[acyl-carrier-protein] reductase [Bdellovibrionales bacterium]|nr:3-oxoacyl-[acyl-carrier-protein] reductase [Bdellovibrionales bacterium]